MREGLFCYYIGFYKLYHFWVKMEVVVEEEKKHKDENKKQPNKKEPKFKEIPVYWNFAYGTVEIPDLHS